MLWNNSSYLNNDRGKSVGGKMANLANRYFQPKFMSKIGQTRPDPVKDKLSTTKYVVKKENVPPQQTKIYSKILVTKDGFDNSKLMSKTGSSVFQKTDKIETDTLKYSIVRGLHNIGNTCYMNSTLQCLFHLPVFNTQLMNEFREKQKGSISRQYCLLLQNFTRSSNTSAINPADFKKTLGRKKPRFLGNSQQDAQEFLTSFLELINEEQTRIENKPKYQELENDPSKKPINQLGTQWWEYYLQRDNSIICDIFQGQIISTVQCKKCSSLSVTFDNFWGMPVSLAKGKSVQQLLVDNWKSQSLIDDYNCGKCKKTRICSKILNLFRIPETLVIQLKRFQYGKYLKRKKNDEIRINHQLDITALMSPHSPIKSSQRYRLCGVIHHFGDTDFGHYTADIFCHKYQKWYNMDDSKFTETQCQKYSRSAYLLFYQRCK